LLNREGLRREGTLRQFGFLFGKPGFIKRLRKGRIGPRQD